MSNRKRTVLYTGVSSSLYSRVSQHKWGVGSAFTSRYKCYDLLYFETFGSINEAIYREKQLKHWKREWKWNLIAEKNPGLVDLYEEIRGYD
ncbi:GIY-YIG nuclease family protein [Fulvivirga sp. 1062]|uniref:GIY-YIG nuclease family protein n=2 Tax=Fulvivirga sedimenti TaxID=2879465 RepID=A0A9X1HML5_9BACT|nr:GIY-YIG nuclease family protein [Fulvivirga sedimenti]